MRPLVDEVRYDVTGGKKASGFCAADLGFPEAAVL